MKPMVIPGVGEGAVASATGQFAAMAPEHWFREAVVRDVSAPGEVESVGLHDRSAASVRATMASTRAQGQAQKAGTPGSRRASRTPCTGCAAGHADGDAGGVAGGLHADPVAAAGHQMVTQPLQQLTHRCNR